MKLGIIWVWGFHDKGRIDIGWTHVSLRYLHILAKEHYRTGAERGPAYFLVESWASTSSSGFRTCHWAMGLLGLASISDQWRSSVPELLRPTKTLPMASFLPILS